MRLFTLLVALQFSSLVWAQSEKATTDAQDIDLINEEIVVLKEQVRILQEMIRIQGEPSPRMLSKQEVDRAIDQAMIAQGLPYQAAQPKKRSFWRKLLEATGQALGSVGNSMAESNKLQEERREKRKDRLEGLRLQELEGKVHRMEMKRKYGVDYGY